MLLIQALLLAGIPVSGARGYPCFLERYI